MKRSLQLMLVVLYIVACNVNQSPTQVPDSPHRLGYVPPTFVTNTVWYSYVDTAVLFGNDNGDEGYPTGNYFRFRAAATVTGVRFHCTSVSSQTYKVHVWQADNPGNATVTDLGSCTTASVASGTHTCTFGSPIAISTLTKVYSPSVWGTAGTADCTYVNSQASVLNVQPCAQSSGACFIGPNLIALTNAYFGTFNTDAAPKSTDSARATTAAEFVFAIP